MGMGGALKRPIECFVFFSLLLDGLPIAVQLLHSAQALPDSSDKVGPISQNAGSHHSALTNFNRRHWPVHSES